MPIEIKELHIRVTVNNPGENQGAVSGNAEPGGRNSTGSDPADLVAECVEQVLQILQNKAER